MAKNRRSRAATSPTGQETIIDLSHPDVAGSAEKDDIARRAHELYEARGRTDGNDVNDWLQAERELERLQVE